MNLIKHTQLVMVHLAVYVGFAAILGVTEGLAASIFAVLLIWASVVDFRQYEIPDTASLLLVLTGIGLHGGQGWLWSLFAAALWGGVFWAVALAARKLLGEDGLGLGDAKLMAGIGAWLGVVLPTYVVLAASVAAILTIMVTQGAKRREFSRKAVAFGPFLCLSAWGIWLSGVQI